MAVTGNWRAQTRQRQSGTSNLTGSLQKGRGAANAGIGKIELGFRENIFFVQQPKGGENRSGLTGTDRRAGTMRYYANRAGSRFALGRMRVSRLRRYHPQHEAQAEPNRPFRA